MEKEKLESLLIDYIDGALDPAESRQVKEMLSSNKEARQLYEELKEVMHGMDNTHLLESKPGHRKTFEQNLKEEMTSSGSKQVFFTPVIYRAAAAVALVMLGLAGGYWINKNNQHEQELAALRQEMAETKQLMLAMLTNDQSASQRMQGVNVALTISKADDEVVNALEKAMTSDPNTNVRLAALDALGKFVNEPQVRKILVNSLTTQNDPVVQIALIQMLVRMKEKTVVNELEKIIEDEKNIQAVKDEAHSGIIKLS